MKRFFCILLCGCMLLSTLCACGKEQETQTAQTDEPQEQALTIQENDTLHINMLFTFMSSPDVAVTELLGDGDSQKYYADSELESRSYSGIAFGQEMTYAVHYNEHGDVDKVTACFPDVSENALHDALEICAEKQFDQDGTLHLDTSYAELQQDDNSVIMTLHPYSGED